MQNRVARNRDERARHRGAQDHGARSSAIGDGHEVAPARSTWLALAGVVASLLGMLAATIIVVVGAFSMRYARRRLQYETWHAIHIALYLAVLLALLHRRLIAHHHLGCPSVTSHERRTLSIISVSQPS